MSQRERVSEAELWHWTHRKLYPLQEEEEKSKSKALLTKDPLREKSQEVIWLKLRKSLKVEAFILYPVDGVFLDGSMLKWIPMITTISTALTESMAKASILGINLLRQRRKLWTYLEVIQHLLIRDNGWVMFVKMSMLERHTQSFSRQQSKDYPLLDLAYLGLMNWKICRRNALNIAMPWQQRITLILPKATWAQAKGMPLNSLPTIKRTSMGQPSTGLVASTTEATSTKRETIWATGRTSSSEIEERSHMSLREFNSLLTTIEFKGKK